MKQFAILAAGVILLGSGAFLSAEPEAKPADKAVAKTEVTVVTVEEAQALLAKKEAPVVIDVRTADEFKEGHLAGAQVIDVRGKNFQEELAKLDRKKSYLLHCRSGGRSTLSLAVWKELGFQKVYHLDCGMLGWEKAKGKTVKGE